MPFYVEFPVDNVVDVHWKKKDDGGGTGDHLECGAFKHGYGLYDPETNDDGFYIIPGNGIFILDFANIYGIGFDTIPGHKSYKPYSYHWSTADYLGGTVNFRDVPFVWLGPRSWTVTVDVQTLVERLSRQDPPLVLQSVAVQEFRNLNIQALKSIDDPVVPDRTSDETITIENTRIGEIYSPGFRVVSTVTRGGEPFLRIEQYPPSLIQAHCLFETTGDYPPDPTEFVGNPFYSYPAAGRNDEPIRPPPPPPYQPE
jgi:hypothetical protein